MFGSAPDVVADQPLSLLRQSGNAPGVSQPWWIACIVWPLAIMCILFYFCLAYGLPEYYKQVPPAVPNFFRTLFRRKLVIWYVHLTSMISIRDDR